MYNAGYHVRTRIYNPQLFRKQLINFLSCSQHAGLSSCRVLIFHFAVPQMFHWKWRETNTSVLGAHFLRWVLSLQGV